MARMLPILFLVCLHSISAHIGAKDNTALEIGREGQLMRQEADVPRSKQVPKAALAEIGAAEEKRPKYREATEAFAGPSKIDDSFFGGWSPRMPGFIEKYPWFYATAFVGCGMTFMLIVCIYVQQQDAKDEERRDMMRTLQRRMGAHGMLPPQRMGAAFAPRVAPPASPAAFRAAAEAAAAAPQVPAGKEPVVPAPKARAVRAVQAAENGMAALTNAVGNFTGMLAGENVKMKMPGLPGFAASPEPTTASGASTPRSHLSSSQQSNASSRLAQQSKYAFIHNGTVLIARVPEVIFASPTSWQEIGELDAGQHVVAAGPAEYVDAYTMVPIKPRGAVDLKTLEVVRDSY